MTPLEVHLQKLVPCSVTLSLGICFDDLQGAEKSAEGGNLAAVRCIRDFPFPRALWSCAAGEQVDCSTCQIHKAAATCTSAEPAHSLSPPTSETQWETVQPFACLLGFSAWLHWQTGVRYLYEPNVCVPLQARQFMWRKTATRKKALLSHK